MPRQNSKDHALKSKYKNNFSSAEVEVLLQELSHKLATIYSSVNILDIRSDTKKWDVIMNSVNFISGEGHTTVRKMSYD